MSLPPSDPAPEAPNVSAATGLRPEYLSPSEVVGQAIGTVAPAGAMVLSTGVVLASAGNGTAFAYTFATVALLLVASSINQFARRGASAGGLYVFAGRGLGPTFGVVAGWSLLIGYLFTSAAAIGGAVGYLLLLAHDLAGIAGGRDLAVGFAIIVVALAWALAYRDIRLSTRTSLWIGAITGATIGLLVVGSLIVERPAIDPAQLQLADVAVGQLHLGLILAFFSFVGFESATVLGSEAQRPLSVIPRAVILCIGGAGLLFLAGAYALVGAFQGVEPGLDKVTAPLALLARNMRLGGTSTIVSAGVALSLFACTLGSLNAGARVLFTLSRHGLVHPAVGHAHALNATPYIALTILAVAALCLSLGLTVFDVGLIAGFGYLGSIATFGFLVAYLLVAVAAPIYLRRIGALKPRHTVAAAITVVLLAIPLSGSVYPVPAWPRAILPYLFLGLIGIGLASFRLAGPRPAQAVLAMQADFRGEAPMA
jgi:amino acid transporter